jgi:CheY-like chemotaxis protein
MTRIANVIASERLRALGCAGQVPKPVWSSRLRDVLDSAVVKNAAPAPSVQPAPVPSSVSPARKSRILVAEDNPTNQEVILALLDQLAYEASAVHNGAQAVEALKRSDYDLVLMDCWMPEMDGYEATRLIRLEGTGVRNPQVPILALTADVMPHVREKCFRVGMNDHLTKPVDLRELKRRLAKWLQPIAPDPPPEPSALPEPPATNPTVSVFDQDDLMDRLMGNAALAHRVVNRFLSGAPAQLAALAEAVGSSDSEGAWKAAHSIKGAAANAGGARLSEAARRIEVLGRTGDLPGVRELAPGMALLLDDYRAEIAKFNQEEP